MDLGGLELDVEASVDVAEPSAKRARGLRVDGEHESGPATAKEAFQWPAHFLEAMYLFGLFGIGVDLKERFIQALMRGLWLATDYSGMGCFEEAVRQVVNGCNVISESTPTYSQYVRFLRAGDSSEPCRAALLGNLAWTKAECVFGNILQRCPAHILKKATHLGIRCKASALRAIEQGMDRKQALSRYGFKYMEKCMKFMMPVEVTDAESFCSHCFKHDRQCRFFKDIELSFAGLRGMVAGKTKQTQKENQVV
jgi:hypothetical protein